EALQQHVHRLVRIAAPRPRLAAAGTLLPGRHQQDARRRRVAAEALPARAQIGQVLRTIAAELEILAVFDVGDAARDVAGAAEIQPRLHLLLEQRLHARRRRTADAGGTARSGRL